MSQLWILEKARDWNGGLAILLMGDFAVRRFQSPAALRFALATSALPEGLILWDKISDQDASTISESISHHTVIFSKFPCLQSLELDAASDVLDLVQTIKLGLKLRRASEEERRFEYLGLVFSPTLKKIWAADNDKLSEALSEKEGLILKSFLEAPSKSLSIARLRELVWQRARVSQSSLESHISRLRKKMRHCSDLNLRFQSREQIYALTQISE